MEEFKLYASSWRVFGLLLLCSIFVFLGIFILFHSDNEEDQWIGWLNILFFGLGVIIFFLQLFDRKPWIIINQTGIWGRNTHKEFINWEIIQDAYLTKVHSQKFICLIIDESFEPSKNKGKWYKKAVKLNKSLGFQELNINIGQVKIDEKKLLQFIKKMSQIENGERENAIKLLKDDFKK